MGACFAVQTPQTMMDNAYNNMWQMQENRYKTINLNCAPFISSTGEICVPINTLTGVVLNTLPQWIQNRIDQQSYNAVIQQINQITQPAMAQMIQLLKQSFQSQQINMSPFQNPNTVMQNQMNHVNQMQQKQNEISLHWTNLRKNIDGLLYTLNSNTLNKFGLTFRSSFNPVRLEQPTHIIIIVNKSNSNNNINSNVSSNYNTQEVNYQVQNTKEGEGPKNTQEN